MASNHEKKRQGFVRQFCVRYGLRSVMSAVDGAEGAQYFETDRETSARASTAARVRPYDRTPKPGDVRLLAKARRLTYALVAEDMGDGQFLVIPFSSYASPATEGELLVKNAGGAGLRVLQPWNAKVWSRPSVAESWRVGTLPQDDVEDALSVWRCTLGLVGMDEELAARTGMRVAECERTVRRYLSEERENLSSINAADARRFPWFIAVMRKPPKPIIDAVAYAQAAGEERTSDVRRAECRVEGVEGCVLIVYNHETGELSLDVYDSAGNVSPALDGWTLVDAAGNELAAIDGAAVRPVRIGEFDGSCFLVDKASGVHALTRVTE